MKNITLSADEILIESARKAAARRGKSLNHLVREFLMELSGEVPVDAEFQRLAELSRLAGGRRRGWRFDRDEIHDRT